MSDAHQTTDAASFPPVMRLTIRTPEPGRRYRDDEIALSVVEWRLGREAALARIARMLDAAASAADEANRKARIGGPVGRLP